jgi:hypothetical protein
MSETSTKPASEPSRGPDEMVNVSELREFVLCERAWYLNRLGRPVSEEAQAQRADGITFHEARAAAAEKGSSAQTVWWIVLLVLAAIALLVVNALLASR